MKRKQWRGRLVLLVVALGAVFGLAAAHAGVEEQSAALASGQPRGGAGLACAPRIASQSAPSRIEMRRVFADAGHDTPAA